MHGIFVTFEGGEGSGKTTQLKLLANRIRASGQEVIGSHDPGGTGIGKEIRTLLLDPGRLLSVPPRNCCCMRPAAHSLSGS